MLPRLRAAVLVLLSIPFLATCGGGEPAEPAPAGLKLTAGDWAAVSNGVVFAATIQVVDSDGQAVAAEGIDVVVYRTIGTAVLSGTLTRSTDAEGQVVFDDLMLVGTSTLTALDFANEELTGASSPIFTLKVGPVATLTKVVGDSQAHATNDTLLVRPRVLARDAGGNPVVGALITATIVAGGGLLIPESGPMATVASYLTGATGEATIHWRLGALGANGISVTVPGGLSVPALPFVATAVPGVPYRYETVSLLNLLPVVDSLYPLAARVTVRDQFGNRLAGAPVRFYNPDSTATTMSFIGDSGVTDAQGEFTLTAWRPGTRAGAYRIGARPGGPATQTVLADYSVVAGPFARIEPPPPIVLARGMFRRFGFQTVDRFGNRVSGIPVTITKVSGAATYVLDAPSDGDFPVDLTAPGAPDTTVLRATSAALPDSAFDAVIRTVAPTAVRRVSGDSQTAVSRGTLPAPIVVRVVDTMEVPVEGVPLHLRDLWYGGTPAQGVSDSAGLVTFAPFSLPVGAGNHAYEVRSPFFGAGQTQLLALNVRQIAGPAVGIGQEGRSLGDTLHGQVGMALASPLRVAVWDADFLQVEGAVVRLTTGQGQLAVDSVITDHTGFATVPGWILDTVSGVQRVTATHGTLAPAQLTAIGDPGPATQLAIVSSAAAEGFVGERLGSGVVVEATDRYNNPAAGRLLFTDVVSGSATPLGTLFLPASGRAYVDLWALGPTPGPSTLKVKVDSAEATFTATAIPLSPFNITVRGSLPALYRGYFVHAAYRWRRAITADVPDVAVSIPAGACAAFQGGLSGSIDDLVIDVSIGPIDGAGGILGGATPCFIRTADTIPILGVMQFDDADFQALIEEGTVGDVVLHEMGHVLGVGSLWSFRGLVANPGTINPQYTGAGGKAGWAEIGGVALGVTTVPVEAGGGPGTAGVHWREAIMPSELMTGFLSAAVNPLSAVSLRSLQDLGYTVDATLADPYTVMTAPPPLSASRSPIRIHDRVGAPQFTVDTDGRVRPIQ